MLKNVAKERAAFLIEMAEAEEAQRNIKPLPLSARELALEAHRHAEREAARLHFQTRVLPMLVMRAEAARAMGYDEKIFAIKGRLQANKTTPEWPEHFFKSTERTSWKGLTGWCRSTLTGRFVRLMNAARGVLLHGHSGTGNSVAIVAGQS